ncbi:MAG TPA: hypothetical protein PLK14_05720 [Sediminibacterium sp.]|nr:hypothetical protein [Sediminibacterium sp.]HQS54583.1 hypothetical protein [Sediminibacterium sp.]
MKKIFAIVLFTSMCLYAQSQNALATGRSQLNFGLGLSNWGIPVYLGLDYGISKDITLGAELSVRNYDEDWNNGTYRQQIIGVIGNGNYHFNNALNIPSNYDFYAGLNVGFNIWTSPTTYGGSHSSGLAIGAQIGGRHYFSNKLGLNLEFSGGNSASNSKIGLSIRL